MSFCGLFVVCLFFLGVWCCFYFRFMIMYYEIGLMVDGLMD